MLKVGAVRLHTPIILAPMAGVTNPPFRRLCREFADLALRDMGMEPICGHTDGLEAGSGLYTCEMITARAVVERNRETMLMITPDPRDPVRSVQVYGVTPKNTAGAVGFLVEHGYADHIDLNFGCPVPKVTRKGGGSALPWKHDLFGQILRAAVDACATACDKTGRSRPVPVTAKIRIGIDEEHETFRDAAQIAADAGISALTLHARTTARYYSGKARWEAIKELKEAVPIPVFGNGDVFGAGDAAALLSQTGCDGVMVGRGCQGRPWIFYDLVAAHYGSEKRYRPTLKEVSRVILEHARLSVRHFGNEYRALRELRKHIGWYLRGFAVGGQCRHSLALVSSLSDLQGQLSLLEDQPYPDAADGPRGRAGGEKKPHLPEHWLDSHYLTPGQKAKIEEAEIGISGG